MYKPEDDPLVSKHVAVTKSAIISVLTYVTTTREHNGTYNINTICDYTRAIYHPTPATSLQRCSYILEHTNAKWLASCQQTRHVWHETVTGSAVTGDVRSVGGLSVQGKVSCCH